VRVVAREALEGISFIIEEKLDGSNCGISFAPDGSLILQSRGHVLTRGPRERQFDLLKRWASHHVAALRNILGRRFVMYGEWLYARHTIPYDRLPHYFLEFDILDRESDAFLSTEARKNLLAGGPVLSVPVLGLTPASMIDTYIRRSLYFSTEMMEGLYLKKEDAAHVIERFKYVRTDFLQAVANSDSHWMDRPIEPNRLAEGVDLFA
jgi:ATP-dependent RNA circularization protein (DNA/RNA ligase family)